MAGLFATVRRFVPRRLGTGAVGGGMLALLAGSVAVASIPDTAGVIHGCYKSNNGQLRIIDTAAGDSCRNGETAISWSQTGQPGPQGIPGLKGDPGIQGIQGLQGQPGLNGKDGAPGKDGINGLNGAAGQDGVNGKDGAPGIQGIQGVQGLPGLNGKDGAPGKDGINGLNGASGKDGVNGKDGAPGIQGIQGLQGLPGLDGKDGAPGAAGPPGPAGGPTVYSTSGFVLLPSGGTTVMSLTLPAGTYLLQGKLVAHSTAAVTMVIGCQILKASTGVDSSDVDLGASTTDATISLLATISLPGPSTVSVFCVDGDPLTGSWISGGYATAATFVAIAVSSVITQP